MDLLELVDAVVIVQVVPDKYLLQSSLGADYLFRIL